MTKHRNDPESRFVGFQPERGSRRLQAAPWKDRLKFAGELPG